MLSEAVLRAMEAGNITSEMMESCDPGLMVSITRLATVWCVCVCACVWVAVMCDGVDVSVGVDVDECVCVCV